MDNVLRTIAEVSAPLALAGLLASFLFYAVREIIKAKLIPAVPKKHAITVILAIINKLFILSLVALVLGITIFALERLVLPAGPRLDRWAVKVYDFQNYGTVEQEAQTGERFSGLILDNLLHRNLDAKAISERPPEELIHIEATRGEQYPHIIDEFYGLGPFISITGYVESGDNGNFLTHVRVMGVNAKQEVKTLMVEELEVPRDQEGMRTNAVAISEVIYRTIESYIGGAASK
jgi:hypothetical protein